MRPNFVINSELTLSVPDSECVRLSRPSPGGDVINQLGADHVCSANCGTRLLEVTCTVLCV